MPLLRRQPFVKQKPPPDLRLDEEVFHCPLTNEIFRDYEDFFNRIILCNSLVWSCALTGRAGLTYQEALESEERAQKQLASMPDSLVKPVLYLATLTHRTRLNDMNDDVFVYAKDRFFIGELVEVFHKGDRKTCKILRVLPPNGHVQKVKQLEDDCIVISDSDESVKESEKPKIMIVDPRKYNYEVRDKRTGAVIVVKMDQISRRKSLFTRDKNKLFLKQNCDSRAGGSGIWKVKKKILKRYKIESVKFENIFAGPPPGFAISQAKQKTVQMSGETSREDALIKKHKKLHKEKKNKKNKEDKKQIAKEKKTKDSPVNEKVKTQMTAEERAELKEKLRIAREVEKKARKEEAKKKLEEDRQKKKEERDKRREEQKQKADQLKEWSKPRDDMECDDLKDLPTPKPMQTLLPVELFGDAMMVLEYVKLFQGVIDPEGVMPQGLTIESLGKSLMDSDSNGMYAELLMYLLMAVFCLQEDEEEEEELESEDAVDVKLPEGFDDDVNMADVSIQDLLKAARAAAQWPQLNFGKSIRKLQMDSFTVTEILRLHVLSSGANVTENNAKFRFQERGGYTSTDDAGLEFLIEEPAVVKALGVSNVYDLTPEMKLKILTLLVRQLLTFVGCRDFIEDNQDKVRQLKNDLKQHQMLVQRRERDETTFWHRKRLEERAKQKEAEEQLKEQKKKFKEERLRVEEIRKDHWLKAREEGKDLKTYLEEHNITLPELPQMPEVEIPPKPSEKPDETTSPKGEETKKEPERKSARKKGKEEENPLFDLSLETIDWEKISPSERGRMKQLYQDKEQQLLEGIANVQQGYSLFPIGRDRTYRRFWVFSSMPGLFIEDDDPHITEDVLQPAQQKNSEPFDSDSLPLIHLKSQTKGMEEKSGSDKENESFDGNTSEMTVTNGDNDKPLSDANVAKTVNAAVDSMDTSEKIVTVSSSQFINVHDQIKARGEMKWSYFSTAEEIDKLIDTLNPRGFREGPLRQSLIEHKTLLAKNIEKCPVKLLSVTQKQNEESAKGTNKGITYQSIKSRNKTTQGMTKNDSAREMMELNLRESLLDLEERLYVGGVGQLKVKNRMKWKDAIENGSYDPQVEQISWSDKTEEVSVSNSQNGKSDADMSMEEVTEDKLSVVRDLAKALLQISQMVFDKYLNPPLGESEDAKKAKLKAALEAAFSGKKDKSKNRKHDDDSESEGEADNNTPRNQKTARARWEESLMSCSSLAQLFLHLTTLEQCLAWAKSALHACCRICRRKGDAEKMLLCDGCDRGHHMYCLKPPVKKIPAGDWFCPACRPKEMKPRTPRKRRKSFMEEEKEELDSSSSEDEDDTSDEEDSSEDDEDSSEEDDSEEEDDSDSDDTEMDTEEEEEPQPTKIKFQTPMKKTGKAKVNTGKPGKVATKPSPPTRQSTRACKSRQSLENKQDKHSKSGRNSARNSLEKGRATSSKTSRASLEKSSKSGRNSARNSLEPEKSSGRSGARTSLGKAEAAKRKGDVPDEEDQPSVKKVASKSRGGDWADQMKLTENLVHELIEHDDSWPFLKPVTRREAPDYFDIIEKPMDFSTIRANMNNFVYKTAMEILEDIQLVFSNCQKYNVVTAEEYKAGQRLVKVFVQRVKQLKLDDLIRQQCTQTANGTSSAIKEISPSRKSRRH